MNNPLNTFVMVYNDEVISPILTTTREYGRWLEQLYGASVAQLELYLKSKTKDGSTVLESHPGTKIGMWFDKKTFEKTEYMCWYVDQDSSMMNRLRKSNVAELRDCVEVQKRRMLRLYTLNQIELYIKHNIDKSFSFLDMSVYLQPKQIKIRDTDFDKMLKPVAKSQKKKLF